MLGTVGSAEAFRALGYLRIQWRVRVVGADGATIGERLVRQLTDAGGSDRERLEFDDGRVYARLDGNVQAERHAMPWPTLEAAAARELAIFSLQAGLPWRLVDPARHVGRGMPRVAAEDGAITLVVAPRPERDPVGPPVESACAQTIELVVDAATLTPREVVTSADAPKDRRRVLLEDWRTWNGLQLPFRRTWLDADGRPATVLELVEVEAGFRTTDKDFRLR